jgi:predicted nucleotidyltransferase
MEWPEPARSTLEALEAELRDLLGANLQGMYVYGSLAFGCYNPARSDIDVIVVTRRRLAVETIGPLSALLRGFRTLEISFLSRPSLVPWRYPTLLDYHFSETSEVRDRLTTFLAGEIAPARARGVALVGPPPEEALPEVPASDYLDNIARDIRWARDRIDERPGYAVLNCCRALAYARTRAIYSKAEGAEWAVGELPERFRPLAEAALEAYRSDPADDEAFDVAEIQRFTEWVEARL